MTAESEAYYRVLRTLSILTGRDMADPANVFLIRESKDLVRDLIAEHGADAFNAAWREASDELQDYFRAGD